MNITTFKCNRKMNINELKEIVTLMEHQETTDRFEDTEITINGDDANITVRIDKDGDVTLI